VRRGQPPAKGTWSLPGGRVEPGEAPAQAARREVREETGLSVRIGELLTTVLLTQYLVHDFAATVESGSLHAGDDASDARWCPTEDLPAMTLSPGLLAELRRLGIV
jgi:8-oxo-dGTP diphosphatase